MQKLLPNISADKQTMKGNYIMKKMYNEPEIEVVNFTVEDVMASSTTVPTGGGGTDDFPMIYF